MRKRENNFRTRSTKTFVYVIFWIACVIFINVVCRVILHFMKVPIDSGLDGCINIFAVMAGSFLAVLLDFLWKAYKLKKEFNIKYIEAVKIQKNNFLSWL